MISHHPDIVLIGISVENLHSFSFPGNGPSSANSLNVNRLHQCQRRRVDESTTSSLVLLFKNPACTPAAEARTITYWGFDFLVGFFFVGIVILLKKVNHLNRFRRFLYSAPFTLIF
jgi:hypothetical protein